MLKQYKRSLSTTFRLLDLLIIFISFFVAYYLRFRLIPLNILALPIHFPIFFFTYLIAWIYLSARFKLYTSKRLTSFRYEAFDICKTTALCLVIATLPAFFIREFPFRKGTMVKY